MADGGALLVPIPLQALLVNAEVLSAVVFERWTNDYSSLNTFQDPVPQPFTNIGTNPAAGVHLLWKLPAALTHGEAPKSSTATVFPYTPNRWIVVRLASTAAAPNAPNLTAWIIQSDYLGADGASPFADPTQSSQAPNIQLTNIGKSWSIAEWTTEPGGALFLTATGIADATFTAFQPGLVDVYSFFDDTTGFEDGTVLTYWIAGWYSDPTHDPLATSTPAKLGWTILGGAPPTAPTVSVFHGLVYDLTWQTTSAPPRIDSDAQSMQVAVGYSTADALAAALSTCAGQAGTTLETQLRSFLSNTLGAHDERDGLAQVERQSRHGWFGSIPGGTMWDIVSVSQGQNDQTPLDSGAVGPPPELTPQQAEWLAALNRGQRTLDAAVRELETLQRELFSAWWKSNYGPVNQPILEQTYNIDMPFVLGLVNTAITSGGQSLLDQVEKQRHAVDTRQATLPIPSSPKSIAKFSAEIPGNSTGALMLKPNAMTPFSQPNDPVVVVAGFSAIPGPDSGQPLPCRLAADAVTGVSVAGGTPASVTSSSLPPNVTLAPPLSPGVTSAAVASAIAALGVEAFFVDPNNAQAIVSLGGVTPNTSSLVQALATAMASGTAQISQIQQPLQASFAFAPWQQAWSPLFIEWQITWFPSVTSTPTGPLEPVGGNTQPPYIAAADNFPFDPTTWAFDGSDGVAQRGFEYYEWQAGNIWTPSGAVQPASYTGRTFLTPHATALLAGRVAGLADRLSDSGVSAAQIDALRTAIGQTPFLSQALGGFNDAFLAWTLQQTPTPPANSPLATAIGDQDRGAPNPDLGNQDYSFGATGTPFFFPLRGGFFQFERLLIVDAFGQVLDLLAANDNATQNGTDQQMAASFYPIRAAGMVPQLTGNGSLAGLTIDRLVNQAPRLAQPSRLDFRLLDADDDSKQVGLAATADPICGWLLPDLIDHSIAVYDVMGDPLGELIVLADASGTQQVTWLPAPDSPDAISDPSAIANAHLRNLIEAFTAANGGIPPDQRVASFQAFFWAIDEALWTIDPRGSRGDRDLATMIGRPLALVRAQLQFELYGQPAYNQSWRDTLQSQTAGFTDSSMTFPIALGRTELLDDGLVGYYTDETYTTFNAVNPSSRYQAPYVVAIGPNNYVSLPFDYPNYTTQNVSLLVDPRGSVNAITGILPDLAVQIPSSFVDPALARMAVTSRIGPVLTDPAIIRLPMPSERGGVWSWMTRTGTGDEWTVAPIIAATAQARLADAPPHLVDGWLKFTPGAVSVNDPTLQVGNAPSAAAVTPDSTLLFVASSADDTVSVIDAQAFRPIGLPIAVGTTPAAIAILADGSRAVVANSGNNSLTAIDVATLLVVGGPVSVGDVPSGIAVTPIESTCFVTNRSSNTVSVIDGHTLQSLVSAPIAVGNAPVGVAVSPDNAHAFVANSSDGTVSVIDVATLSVVGSPIPVGHTPIGIAVSPDSALVFVANQGDNTVTVIDAQTLAVVGQPIAVGNAPSGVAVTQDGGYVLVTNTKDGTVSVIAVTTSAVTAWSPLSVGAGPTCVVVSPDNVYTFVTNQGADTATVLFPASITGAARA